MTAGYDGTLRIWDTGSGQLRTVLRCGEAGTAAVDSRVLRLFLLPGQDLLAVTPREVQVWSMHVMAPAATVHFKRDNRIFTGPAPCAVAFDASSSRLAVVGPDDLIQLYRLSRQTYAAPKDSQSAALPSFWFTSVSATLEGKLEKGHKDKSKITAVTYGTKDSDMLVSGGEDHQILVWRLNAGQRPTVLSGHTGPVTCLAVSPDDKSIVSASRDGTLRLWDVARGTSSQPFSDNAVQSFTALALSMDGKRLVTGDKAGNLHIWDFASRARLQTLSRAVPGPIEQISLTPDGTRTAAVSKGVAAVHDLTTGTRLKECDFPGLVRVALTPDGKTLAIPGEKDRLVRLHDVASGHVRCELPVLSHNVFGLGFNPDGTLLATVSLGLPRWDPAGEVKLWAAALVATK